MLSDECHLEFARNGREGLEIADDFQPDVILLDVMMPGMDGLETCRRFRQLPGTNDAVIIMVSAKAMPSEQAEGLEAGADHYMTKPFDESELGELLRDCSDASTAMANLPTSPDGRVKNKRLRLKYFKAQRTLGS